MKFRKFDPEVVNIFIALDQLCLVFGQFLDHDIAQMVFKVHQIYFSGSYQALDQAGLVWVGFAYFPDSYALAADPFHAF